MVRYSQWPVEEIQPTETLGQSSLVTLAQTGDDAQGQMRTVYCNYDLDCRICGALAEHHDHAHQEVRAAPNEVAIACQAEASRIRSLIEDLQSTLGENEQEIGRLDNEQRRKKVELETAVEDVSERLRPRVQASLQAFRESQSLRDACLRAIDLHERVSELEMVLAEREKAPDREPADGPAIRVGANEAEQFSQAVEMLLREWQFPNLDRVTFSEDHQDVVISGQGRDSHGKGVRAITHAAFNIGILTYCRARSMPHTGVVLIDSPLIVYKQPDQGEGNFSRDVKDAFYRSLATTCKDSQIIIIENDPPPSDLFPSINIVEFTGTDQGRSGFIPKPETIE